MSVTIGTQLGSHEITALLGKGGMGEVYRARDTKLKREVAIKILPDEFSRDAERIARFQREAEALAALNHQNISGIYDLQQSGPTRFLVLEFVDGDTLTEILRRRGALPLDDTLNIAKQICEALEAAHEKGIVHRDLKPANIKVMSDGKVKVLDFGLAKAMEPSPANPDFSNSPTLMSGSMPGVIMGTAAYMSPEQARGQKVDRAADIWSFGCVLYEMLTGKQPFRGETITDILGRIVTSDPDWTMLPETTPPMIRSLLRRLMQKGCDRRLRDIADAKAEIEEALNIPTPSAVTSLPVVTRNKKRERAAWAVAGLAVLALAAISILYFNRAAPPETRLEVSTPSKNRPSQSLLPGRRRSVHIDSDYGRFCVGRPLDPRHQWPFPQRRCFHRHHPELRNAIRN